jgi:NRPS condensation-like uncharacterized protein
VSTFALLTKLVTLALLALAWPHVAFVVAFAIELFRVPRRRLLLELAALGGALALFEHSPGPGYAALGALFLVPFAPKILALNGLDRYFVAQDRPGTPMNSHHFVEVKEPLDRSTLARATASFQSDVAIARSFVHEAFLGVERFVAWHPLFGRPLRFLDRPLEPQDLDAHFDLAREPPFRVLHAPREGGFVLVLTVHHSAADGTGGFLLLERLLRRYEEARTRTPESRLPYEAKGRRFRELLASRGTGWLVSMVRRHVRPMDKLGVQNASLLDDEKPQPYSSRHQLVTLTWDRWESLKDKAQERGLSRNDLLLAAALRAADAWRRARGKPDRPFRVLFPVDLRPLLGLQPSVQNFVGVVRSDFTIEEVRSPDLPLRVKERVQESRTLEEAVETPVNLGFLSALLPPWAFRIALRSFDDDPRSFFFSLLWSNVRIPQDLPLPPTTERAFIRGSLARQPGFGVVVSADGKQLNIALEYLVPLASDDGVRDYGDRLLTEIG